MSSKKYRARSHVRWLNGEETKFSKTVSVLAGIGEDRGVHRVLVGKPEGKRPLGRPRCRWEDNIKMDV